METLLLEKLEKNAVHFASKRQEISKLKVAAILHWRNGSGNRNNGFYRIANNFQMDKKNIGDLEASLSEMSPMNVLTNTFQ